MREKHNRQGSTYNVGPYSYEEKNRTQARRIKSASFVVLLVLFLVLGYFSINLLSSHLNTHRTPRFDDSDTSEYVNKNLYLLMGTDTRPGKQNGQSDSIVLLYFDRSNTSYQLIPINRNTITDVMSYSEDGKEIGTSKVQIALAHAACKDAKAGSENTVKAVSSMLGGIHIKGYYTLNMDGIKALNAFAGGVQVKITDDFGIYDTTLKPGDTVTLTDDQALHFVRGRTDVGDESNEARMKRQIEYISGLQQALLSKPVTPDIINRFHEYMDPYSETDMDDNTLSEIANYLSKYEYKGTYDIKGSTGIDQFGFATFTPDQQSLDDLINILNN